eukprot:5433391-Pleurochrysis_carterae.AAC.1
MASILPLPSDDEIVRRLRCPDSDSPRHYDKAHHLQFMMRVVMSRRRLYPGLGSDPSSRRYRDALLARATDFPLRPIPFGDALTNSMSAARPDSSLPSGARPESTLPSAARPVSSLPSAARPDSSLPSAARPDSSLLSAARPDSSSTGEGPESSSATLSSIRDACEQLNERRMNRPDVTSQTRITDAAPAQSNEAPAASRFPAWPERARQHLLLFALNPVIGVA